MTTVTNKKKALNDIANKNTLIQLECIRISLIFVTRFEKIHFHTHTPARYTVYHHIIAVHTNISGRCQC